MVNAVDTRRTVVELTRARFGQCYEFFQGLCRDCRVCSDRDRRRGNEHDRVEACGCGVGQLRIQCCVHRMAAADRHQRIAIRRRLGGDLRGDGAAGAGPIVHNDLLAEAFAHAWRENTSRHVGATAYGKAHQ